MYHVSYDGSHYASCHAGLPKPIGEKARTEIVLVSVSIPPILLSLSNLYTTCVLTSFAILVTKYKYKSGNSGQRKC